MPIQLAPIPKNAKFCGYTWTVTNEDELARLVGLIYVGRFLHVEKILKKLDPKKLTITVDARKEIKAKLAVKPGADPWHRDGLLFQAISWIAAHQAAGAQNSVFSLPHQIPAHKGFDGLQIEMNKQEKLSGLIVFEDKATENPRSTITKDVWPGLKLLHEDKRQIELMQETTAMLQRAKVADPDEILEGVVWKNIRCYRVSITGANGHDKDPELSALFKGYDEAVPGKDSGTRRAEVICVGDLRPWMAKFAKKVATTIDKEAKLSHV